MKAACSYVGFYCIYNDFSSEQIVDTIQQSGFKISAQKEINLTKELAAQFYKEHEGKEFFNGLTDYMSR